MNDPRLDLFQKLVDSVKNQTLLDNTQALEVDTRIYNDQSHYENEKELIFSDMPFIVGHQSMLVNSGDHFTHDHLGKPLLIVRGDDNRVRAFMNVCRHRGVRLANNTDVSKRSTFVCPYHNWVYALDGALKSVPLEESLPGLDKSCRGLIETPCEVRHGFIWVNPTPNSQINLDEFLGDINIDFERFDVSSKVFFAQSIKTKKTNWKLIVDAFLDGYHVVRLHRKTVGSMFLDSVSQSNRTGLHVRSLVARSEFKEALNMPPEQWTFDRHTTMAYQIFPNTTLIFHPDYLSILSVYPIATNETIVTHQCLIPEAIKNEKEQAHWERAFDIIENGVFEAEDFFVCEQAQIGLDAHIQKSFLLGGYEESIKLYHLALESEMQARKK